MAEKKGSAKKGGAAKRGTSRSKRGSVKRARANGLAVSGLAAGVKGASVTHLQNFLARFGYLQSSTRETFHVSGVAAEPAPPVGVFEESTEQALRQYQAFHGLPVTGVLDDATLGMMSKPRCGVPDLPTPPAPGSSAAFTLQGNKWNKTALTYGFTNFSGDLTNAQVRAAVQQALGLWSAVTPLTFTEVPDISFVPPDIRISFAAGFHGDGIPFDGAGSVLAHGFYPPPNGGGLAGDVHFDEHETWSVAIPVPANRTDLVTVAAHEIGHSLGLEHSSVNGALMFPSYSGAQRFLDADDIAGIQTLYGAGRGWFGWQGLGGVLTSAPAVCSWGPNRLDCFARGPNNAMWHKWWNGSTWSNWEDLGGSLNSAPAAVSRAANRIDCFALATDNSMYQKSWNGSSWGEWTPLGGTFTSAPAVSSWGSNRLDLFGRGVNNALYHKWWNGSTWSGWQSLGGNLTSAPAAVSWGPNRIDVFVRAADNSMYQKWWNGSTWSGWQPQGGTLTSAPAVCSWGPNRLDCFVSATNNAMYHKWWSGSSWSGWEDLGGALTAAPAAVSWGRFRIDCFARATDNSMYHKWYT